MYLCDNEMQLLTAMEDHDYTCWLDPDGVPAYVKEVASNPYPVAGDLKPALVGIPQVTDGL